MTKDCNHCGRVYPKRWNESVRAFAARLFCSKPCYSASQKGRITSGLQKALSVLAGRPSPSKGKKFPERSGAMNPQNKRVQVACPQCGIVRAYPPNRIKENARFCSQLCSRAARNLGRSTQQKRIRKSAEYKRWRTAVYERDNYTCQECGVRGGVELNADHVKPFTLFPELRFDVNNGRTLCRDCHLATPTFGRSAMYRRGNEVVASAQEA